MRILVLIRKENSDFANQCYISAIERFGGEVVKCNFDDHYEDILATLSSVDGVLLTGGDDISPLGLFIINYCVRNNLRLLGICLGMQEMGIYSSNEKVISVGDLRHKVDEEKYVHDVIIDENSKLYSILGTNKIKVNSHHRDFVPISNYFKAVGRSDDGLIEAVEGEGQFQIGVQWHPERMLDYDQSSIKLFEAFLQKNI